MRREIDRIGEEIKRKDEDRNKELELQEIKIKESEERIRREITEIKNKEIESLRLELDREKEKINNQKYNEIQIVDDLKIKIEEMKQEGIKISE